jgi:hypothetical protein
MTAPSTHEKQPSNVAYPFIDHPSPKLLKTRQKTTGRAACWNSNESTQLPQAASDNPTMRTQETELRWVERKPLNVHGAL